jgi:hypothetical protein
MIPTAGAIKDEISIRTATVTDKEGFYKLLLRSGTYNIVAANTNYEPAVRCFVELHSGDALQALDFELPAADKGAVALHVKIEGAEEDRHARISFRQLHECAGREIGIEVKSLKIGDDQPCRWPCPWGVIKWSCPAAVKPPRSLRAWQLTRMKQPCWELSI